MKANAAHLMFSIGKCPQTSIPTLEALHDDKAEDELAEDINFLFQPFIVIHGWSALASYIDLLILFTTSWDESSS